MNFEEFKNKCFDGDEEKALECLAQEAYACIYNKTVNEDTATNIVDSLDQKQKQKFIIRLATEAKANPEKINKCLNRAYTIAKMNLMYEEVCDAETNPFKCKIRKTLLKALIGIVAVALFMWITVAMDMDDLPEAGPYILSVFGSYIAIELTANITNYFRFKKIKKDIDSDKE